MRKIGNKKTKRTELNRSVLKEFVRGKSVAFVGLSPCLKGKGLGREIDSHDIVYRTNMYPLSKDLQVDYGERCDIISFQRAFRKFAPQYLSNGVKYLITNLSDSERDIFHLPHFYVPWSERKVYGREIAKYTKMELRHPTAGMMAYFLTLGCKSFKYYGVTMYQDESGKITNHTEFDHYIDEYKEFWGGGRYDKNMKYQMDSDTSHNFAAHAKYIRHLIHTGKIDIDEYSGKFFE